MRRLGLETNLRDNLTDEDVEGAAEDVTAYMNQAIEGQEQILSGDVCNKWTLSFLDKANEAKYSGIMVRNTHVYLACSFLINLLIVLVILLVTPLMTQRGVITIAAASLFVPILITSWLTRDRPNQLVPIILCAMAAILMSIGASVSIFTCNPTSLRKCTQQVVNNTAEGVNASQVGNFFSDSCGKFTVGFDTTLFPDECKDITVNSTDAFHLDHRLCNYPQYFYYSVIAGLIGISTMINLPSAIKLSFYLIQCAICYCFLFIGSGPVIFDNLDMILSCSSFDASQTSLYTERTVAKSLFTSIPALAIWVIALFLHARQVETTSRLDFLWNEKATEEKEEMKHFQEYNTRLLHNILPVRVAKFFLHNPRAAEELYHQSCESVAVIFASIPNYSDFYQELEINDEGMECLRLLNEIIADFDELMVHQEFMGVEKIKTIGSTYMAAAGLEEGTESHCTEGRHVARLAMYAMRIQDQLDHVNVHSFNNFKMRIGLNVGPVVAGVIGARKPQFDIWGNTVNVASRMESSGAECKIQVTGEVKRILEPLGYTFDSRGMVDIKGKGEMETFWLLGPRPSKRVINSTDIDDRPES